jgi:serine/threonine protein kinase
MAGSVKPIRHDFRLPPGAILGNKYQIIKKIGQGGMGTVYMAYDTQLDIRVAIKVVSPLLADTMDEAQLDEVLKRFQSEAKLAVKIDHPNVIRIYGFNRDHIAIEGRECEIDYLIMELFAGRTLRNTMDISGFEYEEEIRNWIGTYLFPILDGLKEVHAAGIIHRDIKPENFFLKGNIPKLGDFGLSLDFDLPPVTQSVSDIFGTVAYMAPEQYYNFSMAREPADVYAIGKILYESVEGKISDKALPFKQAQLSQPEGAFLQVLNSIIMAATEENPSRRIGSVQELRDRLTQLIKNDGLAGQKPSRPLHRLSRSRFMVLVVLAAMLLAGAGLMHLMHRSDSSAPMFAGKQPVLQDPLESIADLPYPDTLKESTHAADGSTLYLVPPAELKYATDAVPGTGQVIIPPLYISETPVTNQQYIDFLNKNLDRIEIIDDSVYLDHRLALKIGEKIRSYKPIVYVDGKFAVQEAMHSACAVLMVTPAGAEAYAAFYHMRLPRPEEWLYVVETGGVAAEPRLELPAPVMNYSPDKYNLRGINQVGEWGKTALGEWVVMGRSPSDESDVMNRANAGPADYFADTSFRVVQDAPDENMKTQGGGDAQRPGDSGQDETSGLTIETSGSHHHQ